MPYGPASLVGPSCELKGYTEVEMYAMLLIDAYYALCTFIVITCWILCIDELNMQFLRPCVPCARQRVCR